MVCECLPLAPPPDARSEVTISPRMSPRLTWTFCSVTPWPCRLALRICMSSPYLRVTELGSRLQNHASNTERRHEQHCSGEEPAPGSARLFAFFLHGRLLLLSRTVDGEPQGSPFTVG